MAREQRFLVRPRTEIRKQEVIYKTDARVEQSAITGGAVVSDSALQEMTHVVKFVAPLLGSRLHSLRSMVADVIGVQVTVGLLRGNDVLRDFVHGSAKLGPLAGLQSETGGFGPLVNVGIGVHRPALRGGALSDEAAEIIHAAIGFQQFFHRRDALVDVDFAALCPETIFDRDGVHWHVSQFGVWRLREVENALVAPRRSRRQSDLRMRSEFARSPFRSCESRKECSSRLPGRNRGG